MTCAGHSSPAVAGVVRGLLAVGALWLAPATSAEAVEGGRENPHGDLSIACRDCHSTENWRPLLEPLPFDHAATGFEISGMHKPLDCMACHRELVLANIGVACADCHTDSHLGELGNHCAECHSTFSRDPRFGLADFFHDTTRFALTGAHRGLECGSCHQGEPPFEYRLTPLECFGCHLEDFRAAEPDHATAEFTTRCEECHRTDAWSPVDFLTAAFNHDLFFPLRGAHLVIDCELCHRDGFGGTPSECADCHAEDFVATRDPDHQALGLSMACEECHGTSSWEGATEVDHDQYFSLRGVHAVLGCEACHAGGYAGTPTDCADCHLAHYMGAVDPDHAALGLALDCETCHGESAWEVATLDHDPFWVLRGAHRPLDCASCHASGFSNTAADCFACHLADFDTAREPDHRAAGFGLACEGCHRESRWDDTDFDHSFFPHIGGHSGLDCTDCHQERFRGNSRECESCHLDDYRGASSPEHAEAGFPLACESCHGIYDWSSAGLDHVFFPLTAGHAGLDCGDCHGDGFEATPTDCAACHLGDYQQASDPDHQESGFPLDCEVCHDASGWQGAEFDHSSFRLTLGHAGPACEDCHTQGFESASAQCFSCHAADYQGARNPDHESAGFPTDCEQCHATNTWEQSRFDHDLLYYPIYNGSHNGVWDSCETCHLDPADLTFYECLLCHDHNQRDTDRDHDGVEGYRYASRFCLDCHSPLM